MRRVIRYLKLKFLRWLLSDLAELRVGSNTTIIKPDSIVFESLTADPTSPTAGQIWYRSDLERFVYYDGTNVRILARNTDCPSNTA